MDVSDSDQLFVELSLYKKIVLSSMHVCTFAEFSEV